MRVALPQSNVQEAEYELLRASDPESSDFGKHWSHDRVNRWFLPDQNHIDEVVLWLRRSDYRSKVILSPCKGFLFFNSLVSEMEPLLPTSYYIYKHEATSRVQFGHTSYQVPPPLNQHVDFFTIFAFWDAPLTPNRMKRAQPGNRFLFRSRRAILQKTQKLFRPIAASSSHQTAFNSCMVSPGLTT